MAVEAAPVPPGAPTPGPAPDVLSPAETRALLAQAQAGDAAARERLVQANLRLVASVAARFAGRGLEFDDLFQVGCLGLVKAIDRFDLRYEVRFSTYAVPVIMGEIQQWLRAQHPVHLGRGLHDRAARVARCGVHLAQRLGRTPTPAEIAKELAMDREEVVAALDAFQAVQSLDEAVSGDGGDELRLGDRIGAPADADGLIDQVALRAAMARLGEWERRLVLLRFFLDLPQTEVAQRLGVSQAHVSRTEQRILQWFREWLA